MLFSQKFDYNCEHTFFFPDQAVNIIFVQTVFFHIALFFVLNSIGPTRIFKIRLQLWAHCFFRIIVFEAISFKHDQLSKNCEKSR